MKRNDFLKTVAFGAAGSILPARLKAEEQEDAAGRKRISFGIISDLHQDFSFDAPDRLRAFIKSMNQKKPDFILQLGDFCVPKDENMVIMDIWNQFPGSKYHVIGNHEFDQQSTLEQIVRFFKMPANYYSFDIKGYHFIVLDGNGKIPSAADARYPSYFNEEQLSWLENDINTTTLPCIVFCHQGLDHNGVTNRESVRLLLQNCNKKSGYIKVKAVFSGHHHLDYYNQINGIHYIQVNSATYRWLGKAYNNTSLPAVHYEKYPLIRNMAYYEDPIWAYVEISENGRLTVAGRKTSWKGFSPYDMGMKPVDWDYPSLTSVSDRNIQL